MGDRGITLSASPAARRSSRKISAAFTRPASRNSAHRRYFLSEKLDGCHARRAQHSNRGRHGSDVSECREGLSDSTPPHYPPVRGRIVSRCGKKRGIATKRHKKYKKSFCEFCAFCGYSHSPDCYCALLASLSFASMLEV